MRQIGSRAIAVALAGAMAITAVPFGSAQAASPKAAPAHGAPAKVIQVDGSQSAGTATDISARRRYYRRGGGNPAAAIAAFGLIAGAIAASQQPRYGYGYGYGYGAPPPAYGYYGYGGGPYRGGYGYRYW